MVVGSLKLWKEKLQDLNEWIKFRWTDKCISEEKEAL